jgi:hypothetical protein
LGSHVLKCFQCRDTSIVFVAKEDQPIVLLLENDLDGLLVEGKNSRHRVGVSELFESIDGKFA